MDEILALSPEQSRVVSTILASFSKRAKFPISLEYLLQKWCRFVTEVEQGYDDSIFDYTNSLGIRDYLEELMRQVPQPLQDKLISLVQPYDNRFGVATKEVNEALLPSLDNKLKWWWWYRVPKKLHEPPYDYQHWKPYYN